MKIHIPIWLIDTLKDFRKAIIGFAVVSGIGALIFAFASSFYTLVFALISTHIVIIALSLLILLSIASAYLLGKRNEKKKLAPKAIETISVVQQELLQYGSFKWDVTIYSNGHFKVAPFPYCAHHDMRLVEQWPLYFCPVYEECRSQISYKDIPIAKDQVESYIESELRKRRTQQGQYSR